MFRIIHFNNRFICYFSSNFCCFFYLYFKDDTSFFRIRNFGYFTVTFPFSTLSSVGTGLSPTASGLSFTYSKPDGISSSIFTSTNFPPSTVPLKVIRYSISSLALVHDYLLLSLPLVSHLYIAV